MPEKFMIPADEFHVESRHVRETGGRVESGGRELQQYRYTLPCLPSQPERSVRYDIRSALCLSDHDFCRGPSNIFHDPKIVGIPQLDTSQEAVESLREKQSIDYALASIGLGPLFSLAARMRDRFWLHIHNVAHHRVRLQKHDTTYGTLEAKSVYLRSDRYLWRNGFDTTEFDLPDHITDILVSAMTVRMTRQEVQNVLQDSAAVTENLGGKPRIVVRQNLPFSLYRNTGHVPQETLFTYLQSFENGADTQRRTLHASLERVRHEKM